MPGRSNDNPQLGCPEHAPDPPAVSAERLGTFRRCSMFTCTQIPMSAGVRLNMHEASALRVYEFVAGPPRRCSPIYRSATSSVGWRRGSDTCKT